MKQAWGSKLQSELLASWHGLLSSMEMPYVAVGDAEAEESSTAAVGETPVTPVAAPMAAAVAAPVEQAESHEFMFELNVRKTFPLLYLEALAFLGNGSLCLVMLGQCKDWFSAVG